MTSVGPTEPLQPDVPAWGASLDAPAPEPVDEALPAPMFPNVDEWVREYFLPNYARSTLHATWCATWWEHAEAISRLEALWEAWEALRLQPPTGLAIWWRDYADPTMAVLTSKDGPFSKCGPTGDHQVPPELPTRPAPLGLFRSAGHPEERPRRPTS